MPDLVYPPSMVQMDRRTPEMVELLEEVSIRSLPSYYPCIVPFFHHAEACWYVNAFGNRDRSLPIRTWRIHYANGRFSFEPCPMVVTWHPERFEPEYESFEADYCDIDEKPTHGHLRLVR